MCVKVIKQGAVGLQRLQCFGSLCKQTDALARVSAPEAGRVTLESANHRQPTRLSQIRRHHLHWSPSHSCLACCRVFSVKTSPPAPDCGACYPLSV